MGKNGKTPTKKQKVMRGPKRSPPKSGLISKMCNSITLFGSCVDQLLYYNGDDTPDERIEEVRYLLGFGEDGICILNGAKTKLSAKIETIRITNPSPSSTDAQHTNMGPNTHRLDERQSTETSGSESDTPASASHLNFKKRSNVGPKQEANVLQKMYESCGTFSGRVDYLGRNQNYTADDLKYMEDLLSVAESQISKLQMDCKTLRDMIEELSKQNTNDATGSTAAPADQSEEANLNQRLIGVSNNLLGNENNIADQNATGSSVAVLRPWV